MSDPVVQYLRQEQTKLKIVERNKSAAIAKVDKLKSDIRQQERVLIEKRKRKVQLEKENMALNNWYVVVLCQDQGCPSHARTATNFNALFRCTQMTLTLRPG